MSYHLFFLHYVWPLEFPAQLPGSILSEAPTQDQTLHRRDPTCPGEIKNLISFHGPLLPPPGPLLPLLHLSSLPPAWALLVFFSFSARVPWVIISSHKYNVECQLPLSSLTRPHSANSICRTTTRSAGEIPTSWVNHSRLSSALQAPLIWSYQTSLNNNRKFAVISLVSGQFYAWNISFSN